MKNHNVWFINHIIDNLLYSKSIKNISGNIFNSHFKSGRNFPVARIVDIDQDPSYWSGSTTLIRMILTCTCRGTAGWSWPSPWPSPASGNTVNKHYIVFFMTLFQWLILKQYFVLHRSNVSNLHILWCELRIRIHVRLRLHLDPDPRGLNPSFAFPAQSSLHVSIFFFFLFVTT